MKISFQDKVSDVTKNLIIINVIAFLAQMALPRIGIDFTDSMGLHYFGSDRFGIWQLVTYMFLHGNVSHIFFNMFALWMFGSTLERIWGSWRFLVFYLVTGVGAALVQELVWSLSYSPELLAYYADALLTIGASGAVYGILLGFGMMFPNAPIFFLFIPIPIKAKWFVLGYGLLELFYGVTGSADGVAHFAHLGGMLFGFILIKVWEKRARASRNDGWQDFY
ncbi:MAG: rhomboid family intramembrane serine protease [Bacteroidales bacterium]|uniref:rhomboid family intramembrane serine protease n=1 Tax=Porphyromonas sp. TaxID=1924944 RepID=UPI002971F365|nr:rhomboid family intramembrane serine protease [Porphyromonas sp.]MDD7438058.1 rhomboid family intramembrane serine protease [Bacteroidales bacterium]MDY3067688.1 rhomboid family intramembrane serine protease [Porphyromonas sp.]